MTTFLAVVRAGNFHAAARALEVTQGAISQAVKQWVKVGLGVSLGVQSPPRQFAEWLVGQSAAANS